MLENEQKRLLSKQSFTNITVRLGRKLIRFYGYFSCFYYDLLHSHDNFLCAKMHYNKSKFLVFFLLSLLNFFEWSLDKRCFSIFNATSLTNSKKETSQKFFNHSLETKFQICVGLSSLESYITLSSLSPFPIWIWVGVISHLEKVYIKWSLSSRNKCSIVDESLRKMLLLIKFLEILQYFFNLLSSTNKKLFSKRFLHIKSFRICFWRLEERRWLRDR